MARRLFTAVLATLAVGGLVAGPVGALDLRVGSAKKNGKIVGTSKSDVLNGSASSDKIFGKGGNDTLNGNGGDDTISGDAGNDVITGGQGSDVLLGGTGNDRIYARDGEVDTIACGRGRDAVTADATDVITGECEVVRVPKS